MNNSKLQVEQVRQIPVVDMSPFLRKRLEELAETIESLQAIAGSSYWKVLERNLWGGVLQSIDKRLRDEKDEKEVYRLQGQAGWASTYCDLSKLIEKYKLELTRTKQQLNG